MHPNPVFHDRDQAEMLQFAVSRGFGVFTLAGVDGAPLAAHAPFALADDGDRLECHLMRSNPIARRLREGPTPALLAVSGPDSYVSPDWYGLGPDHVPTWNYVAVHVRGSLALASEVSLRDHLDRLSAAFESRLLPKPPWSTAKMSDATYVRMARSILPVHLSIDAIAGTWKLNQNKPAAARARAAEAIAEARIGSEAPEIARLMTLGAAYEESELDV